MVIMLITSLFNWSFFCTSWCLRYTHVVVVVHLRILLRLEEMGLSPEKSDFSRAVCWDGGRGWTAGQRRVFLMWEVWTSPRWAGPQDFSLTVSSKALGPSNHNISVDITTQLRASSERSTNTAEWDWVIPAQRGGLRRRELYRPSVHHDNTHDPGALRGTAQKKTWITKRSSYLKHKAMLIC